MVSTEFPMIRQSIAKVQVPATACDCLHYLRVRTPDFHGFMHLYAPSPPACREETHATIQLWLVKQLFFAGSVTAKERRDRKRNEHGKL
jgi:hypothetical protein